MFKKTKNMINRSYDLIAAINEDRDTFSQDRAEIEKRIKDLENNVQEMRDWFERARETWKLTGLYGNK